MMDLYVRIIIILLLLCNILLCSIVGVYFIKYYTIDSNKFFIVLGAIFFLIAVLLGIIILRVGFE